MGNQWALARAGHIEIDEFLTFLDAFRDETDRSVVESIVDRSATINAYLVESEDRPAFAAYVEKLLGPQLAELGMAPAVDEPDDRRLRRVAVVRALGRMARLPAVVAEAERGLERYWADSNAIDPNLVNTFIAIAAQGGDAAALDRYVSRMEEDVTPQDRQAHLVGLSVFEAPPLVQRALELSLTPAIRTQDVGILLASLLSDESATGGLELRARALERHRAAAAALPAAAAGVRDQRASLPPRRGARSRSSSAPTPSKAPNEPCSRRWNSSTCLWPSASAPRRACSSGSRGASMAGGRGREEGGGRREEGGGGGQGRFQGSLKEEQWPG